MVSYATHKQMNHIRALEAAGDVRRLLKLLHHKEAAIRFRTAWALAKIGDKQAYQPLVELLWDPVPEVVRWAITSLAEFGDPSSVEPMVKALQAHHSTWLESRVEHAILNLGPQACLPYLLKLLEDPEHRTHAARRLVALGSLAVEPLLELLDKAQPATLPALVRVLGQLGDSRAVEPLEALMARQPEAERPATKQALAAIESAHQHQRQQQLFLAQQMMENLRHDKAAQIYQELGMEEEAQQALELAAQNARDRDPADLATKFF